MLTGYFVTLNLNLMKSKTFLPAADNRKKQHQHPHKAEPNR